MRFLLVALLCALSYAQTVSYSESSTGTCDTVSEAECASIASERGLAYNGGLNNALNPPGCFIHYGNHPDNMFYNSATGQDYDCDSTKTCVCQRATSRIFSTLDGSGGSGPNSLAGYNGTPLEGEVTMASGIQIWTVPASGTYWIEAGGAMGYDRAQGATIRGKFSLSSGDEISILVGQQGTSGGYGTNYGAGGGGGGTFVAVAGSGNTLNLLIAAGGGGSSGDGGGSSHGADNGSARGNSAPEGQDGSVYSAGYNTNGASNGATADGVVENSAWGYCYGGRGWNDIYDQNTGVWDPTHGNSHGGFGGGGGACMWGGSGGGGYSGGGATSRHAGGGGGGSYNAGSDQINTIGGNGNSQGYVTVELIQEIEPCSRDIQISLERYWPEEMGNNVCVDDGHDFVSNDVEGSDCSGLHVCYFTPHTIDMEPREFSSLNGNGGTGPSSLDGYNGTPLQGEVSLSSGIQTWIVPTSGTYWIEAGGARGHDAARGATTRGQFELSEGDEINILVGQNGIAGSYASAYGAGGGGGGTFVALAGSGNALDLLVAAGGGGSSGDGGGYSHNQDDGTARGNSGTSGSNGAVYSGNYYTTGASNGNSADGVVENSAWGYCYGGKGWNDIYDQNSGVWSPTQGNTYGGFGGGGGACMWGGSGGGGYSGGGATSRHANGGGGGSYNDGTEQTSTTGGNTNSQGYVTITLIAVPRTAYPTSHPTCSEIPSNHIDSHSITAHSSTLDQDTFDVNIDISYPGYMALTNISFPQTGTNVDMNEVTFSLGDLCIEPNSAQFVVNHSQIEEYVGSENMVQGFEVQIEGHFYSDDSLSGSKDLIDVTKTFTMQLEMSPTRIVSVEIVAAHSAMVVDIQSYNIGVQDGQEVTIIVFTTFDLEEFNGESLFESTYFSTDDFTLTLTSTEDFTRPVDGTRGKLQHWEVAVTNPTSCLENDHTESFFVKLYSNDVDYEMIQFFLQFSDGTHPDCAVQIGSLEVDVDTRIRYRGEESDIENPPAMFIDSDVELLFTFSSPYDIVPISIDILNVEVFRNDASVCSACQESDEMNFRGETDGSTYHATIFISPTLFRIPTGEEIGTATVEFTFEFDWGNNRRSLSKVSVERVHSSKSIFTFRFKEFDCKGPNGLFGERSESVCASGSSAASICTKDDGWLKLRSCPMGDSRLITVDKILNNKYWYLAFSALAAIFMFTIGVYMRTSAKNALYTSVQASEA